MLLELVTLQFIIFRTLDGRDVSTNVAHIVSVARAKDPGKSTFSSNVHCVITLLDKNFVSVAEECDSVRKRLNEIKR
jgi:hypothetical protein